MQSKPGSLAVLCYSLFTAVTACVPQAPVAPSPQYAGIRLGAYRFTNYATNTALSIEDSNVDSAVVLMYVVDDAIQGPLPVKADDDAQIWQVIDISSNVGASFVNNRTGGFLRGFGVGEQIRTIAPVVAYKPTNWAIQHSWFWPVDSVYEYSLPLGGVAENRCRDFESC
ncbi:MAG: hypothetical protein Q9185_006427 [Variospora sp. 1 TL-2023]